MACRSGGACSFGPRVRVADASSAVVMGGAVMPRPFVLPLARVVGRTPSGARAGRRPWARSGRGASASPGASDTAARHRGSGISIDGLQAEVARLRESGALGRSHGLAQLFDHLANQALRGRPVREADLAADVFGQGGPRRPRFGPRVCAPAPEARRRSTATDGSDEGAAGQIPAGARGASSGHAAWSRLHLASAAMVGTLALACRPAAALGGDPVAPKTRARGRVRDGRGVQGARRQSRWRTSLPVAAVGSRARAGRGGRRAATSVS